MVQLELEPEIIQPCSHGKPMGSHQHPILVNKAEKPLVKEDLVAIEYAHKADAVLDDLQLDHKRIRRDSDNKAPQGVDPAVLAALEDRQEAILERLEELRRQVAQLTGKTGDSGIQQSSCDIKESSCGIQDLVLSAHPDHPPLCLLVLQQLLAKQNKMLASCHCHSSVSGVPGPLRSALGREAGTANRGQYGIVFTLVWKDVSHGPTLMVSPQSQVLLEGEGPIARYLARLLQPSYDSADSITATEIDQWVDTMTQFSRANNKEKNAILKTMNSKLGKGDWLVGGEMSLADVAMWSALVGSDGVPGHVAAWLGRCGGREEFRTVVDRVGGAVH